MREYNDFIRPFSDLCGMPRVNVGVFLCIPESKASDHQFRYLANFMKWVNSTALHLLTADVRVTVDVIGKDDEFLRQSSCSDCCKRAKESGLLNAVSVVNWESMDRFVLENSVVVSIMHFTDWCVCLPRVTLCVLASGVGISIGRISLGNWHVYTFDGYL